jgi:hypothetical protein
MIISVSAITRELVLACRQLGLVVTETLAAFVAVTIVNSATGTFYVAKPLEEGDARAVVEAAVKKLFSKKVSPDLKLLMLQASFESTLHEAERADAAKETDLEQKHNALLQGVKSEDAVQFEKQNFEQISETYRQIFQWLLVKCGHPDTTVQARAQKSEVKAVEREVAAALESVFPRVGLRAFVSLTPNEKGAQLQELASIVMGIRLFNAHLGKGGTCLPLACVDQKIIDDAAETLRVLQVDIDRDNTECEKFVAFYVYGGAVDSANKPTQQRLMDVLAELMYRRQMVTYLLQLLDDVSQAQERLTAAVQQYHDELEMLDSLVGAKTSVPKEQVYPRFDSLARIFKSCWIDMQKLTRCTTLLNLMKQHRSEYCPAMSNEEQELLAGFKAMKSAVDVGLADKDDEEPASPANGCAIVKPEDEGFLQLGLDMQGFCVVTLTDRAGLCVSGNPQLGVVKYKHGEAELALCFSTVAAMKKFIAEPERYLQSSHALPNALPGLIELVRMDDAFPQSSLQGILKGTAGVKLTSGPIKADVECNTPVHFVEENFDPTYEWNEWTMREKALKLADISKKVTSTTQTKISALRRDSSTQVYLPKEKATNTSVSQGTNPPQWKRYITGLRGESTDVKVVDLKFEL